MHVHTINMNFLKKRNYITSTQKGFTLIELLIVIAIIAILAAVAFVALDPLTRFRDSRDAARWADITAIINAIKIDQVDNGGEYVFGVSNATATEIMMISNATTTSGCEAFTCDQTIVDTNDCINIQDLVTEGYLGELPVSPKGATTWTSAFTGYYLIRSATGTIKVGACESENTSEISIIF